VLSGLLLTVVLAACGDGSTAGPAPAPATSAVDAGGSTGGLAIVLPPADGLADAERARVRLLVDRALDTSALGASGVLVIEPADAEALVDTVELAVRRVGARGTVCVLGADLGARLAPTLALYPATRGCLVPIHTPAEDAVRAVLGPDGSLRPLLVADVDLDRLGRELGAAARAAAGDGTVLVLDGGDVMLDRRWRSGVEAGALVPPGASGAVVVLTTATEVLALIDEQAALIASGVIPGGPEALRGAQAPSGVELPEREDLPVALTLPPVTVVVLDAGPQAALLAAPLAERGMLVVGPRSLLPADGSDAGVVARWRVRWDVSLTALLRAVGTGPQVATATEDVIVLEPGPAHVAP